MPNHFVGNPERLSGRANATWGMLAVLLKNGKPEHLYTPGQRIRRGVNAPLFGVLEIVQVNTDDEPIKLIFDNVLTAMTGPYAIEGYSIPVLTLSIRARLNPANHYDAFKLHIDKHGPRFADALLDQITNGLDALVRATLSTKTISDLRRASISDVLGASDLPLTFGTGVLQITSLVANAEWPHAYTALVDTAHETAIGVAREKSETAVGMAKVNKDKVLSLGEVENEAAILKMRMKLLRPIAYELNIPVDMLLYPERLHEIESVSRDLLSNVLQSNNMRILRDQPGLLNALLAHSGLSTPAPQRAMYPVGRNDLPGKDRVSGSVQEIEPLDVEEVYSDDLIPALTVDRRLASVWERVYGPEVRGELKAIGSSVIAGSGTVVVVSALKSDSETRLSEFTTRLRSLLDVHNVKVLELSQGNRDGLLREWLVAAEGRGAEDLEVITEVVDDNGLERMSVFIGGDAPRARETVQRLASVRNTDLLALAAILPYAAVKLYAGEPGSI